MRGNAAALADATKVVDDVDAVAASPAVLSDLRALLGADRVRLVRAGS
jgi:hypothetical protein